MKSKIKQLALVIVLVIVLVLGHVPRTAAQSFPLFLSAPFSSISSNTVTYSPATNGAQTAVAYLFIPSHQLAYVSAGMTNAPTNNGYVGIDGTNFNVQIITNWVPTVTAGATNTNYLTIPAQTIPFYGQLRTLWTNDSSGGAKQYFYFVY